VEEEEVAPPTVRNGSKLAEDFVVGGLEETVGVHIAVVAVDPMRDQSHSDKNTDGKIVVVVVVVVVVGCQAQDQV